MFLISSRFSNLISTSKASVVLKHACWVIAAVWGAVGFAQLGFTAPPTSSQQIVGSLELKDGRKLAGLLTNLTGTYVTWKTSAGPDLTIPLTAVKKISHEPVSPPTLLPTGHEQPVLLVPSPNTLTDETNLNVPVPQVAAIPETAPKKKTVEDKVKEKTATVELEEKKEADPKEEPQELLTPFEENLVAPLPSPVACGYRYTRRNLKLWTKRFEIGGRFLDGNSEETSINTEGRFEKRCDTFSTRIDIGGKWGEAGGVRTAEQMFGNANVDFGEVGSWIIFVTSQNQNDKLQDLEYRGTLSGGVGYRFFDDADRRLICRLGPGVTAEEFDTPGNDRITPDIFGETEFQWPLFDRTKFESKSTIKPSVEDFSLFRFTNDLGVLVQLDEDSSWQFKIGVKHEYNSQPADQREKSDYTSTVQLVYTLK